MAQPFPPQLVSQLSDIRRAHNIPVLAVALQHGQETSTLVLGGRTTTPLRWGSITKTVTALTVLRLAARGQLDLEATLATYVPASFWRNPWRQQHPVRVIDLLELRAGFTDLSAEEFNFNQPVDLATALALNPDHRVTRWPPGFQHGYSNLTPGLTQLLIERVTGRPFAAVVAEEVLQPFGMDGAGFAPDPGLPGGFKADGRTPIPYWHMTFPAYGALNASVEDMLHLLHGLQTLPPLLAARVYQPTGRKLAPDFGFDYAAGLYPRVRQGLVWHSHGGDADGYRSRLALLRAQERAYVVNINIDDPGVLRQIERLLEAHLTDDLPAPRQPDAPADAALDDVTGNFYPSAARFGLTRWLSGQATPAAVQREGNRLLFRHGQREVALLPVAPGRYRRRDDPLATVAFIQHEGTLYLQGELGHFVRTPACPEFMSVIPVCHP